MARRYYDSHDFYNDSDENLSVMLEPGEHVRVKDSNGRFSYDYFGEDFGYELEVEPGQSVSVVSYAG